MGYHASMAVFLALCLDPLSVAVYLGLWMACRHLWLGLLLALVFRVALATALDTPSRMFWPVVGSVCLDMAILYAIRNAIAIRQRRRTLA